MLLVAAQDLEAGLEPEPRDAEGSCGLWVRQPLCNEQGQLSQTVALAVAQVECSIKSLEELPA